MSFDRLNVRTLETSNTAHIITIIREFFSANILERVPKSLPTGYKVLSPAKTVGIRLIQIVDSRQAVQVFAIGPLVAHASSEVN